MDDNRYQQALNYRDGKESQLTREESLQKAEDLFKILALEENPKAIHNYAMIQYQKGNFELAYEWFEKAGHLGLEASKSNAANLVKNKKVNNPSS